MDIFCRGFRHRGGDFEVKKYDILPSVGAGSLLTISQAKNTGELGKNTCFLPHFSSPTIHFPLFSTPNLFFSRQNFMFSRQNLLFSSKNFTFSTKNLQFSRKNFLFSRKISYFRGKNSGKNYFSTTNTPTAALIQLQMKI